MPEALHPGVAAAVEILAASSDPRARQKAMALLVTAQFHGIEAALAAQAAAEAIAAGSAQADMAEGASLQGLAFPIKAFALLRALGLCATGNQARHLITGGGVKLDGVKLEHPDTEFQSPEQLHGKLLSIGRKTFRRLEA